MEQDKKQIIINEFIDFCKQKLRIDYLPNIEFITDRKWVTENRSFGGYNPYYKTLTVYINNRNLADILRTLSHELVHHKQNELGQLKSDNDGNTGSDIENEANSISGIIMREFGQKNNKIYENKQIIKQLLLIELQNKK
jgi:Zn-dependent peptidase ImmA (M78 family)